MTTGPSPVSQASSSTRGTGAAQKPPHGARAIFRHWEAQRCQMALGGAVRAGNGMVGKLAFGCWIVGVVIAGSMLVVGIGSAVMGALAP